MLRSLPLPHLGAVTRADARAYFDNSWTLFEMLFAGLKGEEPFYRPPVHGLRHPQIFYYGHTPCLYVNKLRVAGVLDGPVNAYFESIFEGEWAAEPGGVTSDGVVVADADESRQRQRCPTNGRFHGRCHSQRQSSRHLKYRCCSERSLQLSVWTLHAAGIRGWRRSRGVYRSLCSGGIRSFPGS